MNDKFLNNLKKQAEDNPVGAIGATAVLMGMLAKLIHASAEARNSRSWARETKRRAKKDRRK